MVLVEQSDQLSQVSLTRFIDWPNLSNELGSRGGYKKTTEGNCCTDVCVLFTAGIVISLAAMLMRGDVVSKLCRPVMASPQGSVIVFSSKGYQATGSGLHTSGDVIGDSEETVLDPK